MLRNSHLLVSTINQPAIFLCVYSWLAENSNRIRSMIRPNGDATRERSTRHHKTLEKCSWQLDAFKGISAASCWTQRNKNKHCDSSETTKDMREYFLDSRFWFLHVIFSTKYAHYDVYVWSDIVSIESLGTKIDQNSCENFECELRVWLFISLLRKLLKAKIIPNLCIGAPGKAKMIFIITITSVVRSKFFYYYKM